MQYDAGQRVERWDKHTERMVSAAKAGIGAVTILNSGSWIALLSQVDGLSKIEGGGASLRVAMLSWGIGALLSTLCWLFVYWSASAQYRHDMDRERLFHRAELRIAFWAGLLLVMSALVLFGRGVLALGNLIS